jgi:hypothetical protein
MSEVSGFAARDSKAEKKEKKGKEAFQRSSILRGKRSKVEEKKSRRRRRRRRRRANTKKKEKEKER